MVVLDARLGQRVNAVWMNLLDRVRYVVRSQTTGFNYLGVDGLNDFGIDVPVMRLARSPNSRIRSQTRV